MLPSPGQMDAFQLAVWPPQKGQLEVDSSRKTLRDLTRSERMGRTQRTRPRTPSHGSCRIDHMAPGGRISTRDSDSADTPISFAASRSGTTASRLLHNIEKCCGLGVIVTSFTGVHATQLHLPLPDLYAVSIQLYSGKIVNATDVGTVPHTRG